MGDIFCDKSQYQKEYSRESNRKESKLLSKSLKTVFTAFYQQQKKKNRKSYVLNIITKLKTVPSHSYTYKIRTYLQLFLIRKRYLSQTIET